MIRVTIVPPGSSVPGARAAIWREVERAELAPEQEHGDQHAEVADPVHDEGLLAGVGVGLLGEPEADQQIGAEPHAFPADEQDREVGAQHQHQHEHHEEVEVGEVARVAGIRPHVAHAEQVDEAPDAGHHQQHDRGELVHLEREIHLKRRRPASRTTGSRDAARAAGWPRSPRNTPTADPKAPSSTPGPTIETARMGGSAAEGQGSVDEEPGQGKRHGEPDPLRSDHQPRSRLMFWRSTD